MLQITQGNLLGVQSQNSLKKHHQPSLSVDFNRQSLNLNATNKSTNNFTTNIKQFHSNSQSMQFYGQTSILNRTNSNKFNLSSSRKYDILKKLLDSKLFKWISF
jgi:hypothetical protein